MKFPNKLIITLKDAVSKIPLIDHIIFLQIFAPRKNDYNIGPRLTNNLGQVIFTETEVKDDIDWIMNQAIMDYSGKYEECSSDFNVILSSVENIRRSLDFLDLYKEFDERYLKALSLMKKANNRNLLVQKWKYNAELLILKDGIAQIECLADITKYTNEI